MEKAVVLMAEQPDTNRALKRSTVCSRHKLGVLSETQSLVWKKLIGIDVRETG
jgi:hypothetical protein